MALCIFFTQDNMGLDFISKCYFYSFHLISVTLYEDIGYFGRILPVTFLAIGQYLKLGGTLEF